MFIEAQQAKMAFLKVNIGALQNFLYILKISVQSTSVPNFIEMQGTWCNFEKNCSFCME